MACPALVCSLLQCVRWRGSRWRKKWTSSRPSRPWERSGHLPDHQGHEKEETSHGLQQGRTLTHLCTVGFHMLSVIGSQGSSSWSTHSIVLFHEDIAIHGRYFAIRNSYWWQAFKRVSSIWTWFNCIVVNVPLCITLNHLTLNFSTYLHCAVTSSWVYWLDPPGICSNSPLANSWISGTAMVSKVRVLCLFLATQVSFKCLPIWKHPNSIVLHYECH